MYSDLYGKRYSDTNCLWVLSWLAMQTGQTYLHTSIPHWLLYLHIKSEVEETLCEENYYSTIYSKGRKTKCTFTAISIMPLVTWHQQCIIPSYFLSVFPVRLKWEGEIQWKSSSDGNGVFCYKFMYLFTHMWAKCFWELASKWSNSLSQSWFSV